jgi:tripartite-type tricarboxylate transporter receptor subunit TctC
MLGLTLAPLLAASSLGVARAQGTWPTRPMKIVVPFGAGGAPDAVARKLGEHWAGVFGQPVVVENRVGAGGLVGAEAIAKAPPDGYTLGISNGGAHAAVPAVRHDLPFHPLRDFTHLAMLTAFPLALAVSADGPVRSLADFIAMARAKPGGATVGSPGVGGTPHFTVELVKLREGVELVHVPFRSGGQAATEVVAGRLDGVLASFSEFVANDRLRVIGLCSAERHPGWSAVPTMREQGLDLRVSIWFGLCGPAGLPDPIADRLARETEVAMSAPDMRTLLSRLGAPPQEPLTRSETTALIAREGERWAEVARRANIRLE